MEYLHTVYVSNLNVVCRDGGRFTLQEGGNWSVDEYRFSQNKFYYFLKGQCLITIEGQPLIAQGGDWVFIPAGTRHHYRTLPGKTFEKYWCHFDLYPDNITQVLPLPFVIREHNDKESNRLFKQLIDALSGDELSDSLRAKSALLSLLAKYIDLASANKILVQGDDESRIRTVLEYINDHLPEQLNNTMLADMIHMHPNHFIRFFSQKTGQSPYHYLISRRMETAKQLLEQTDLSVSQIMERVGIQDSGYFARTFRKYYALTPSQYRFRCQTSQGT